MTVAKISTDVSVVGSGLVGLSAALAMHQLGLDVTLVDAEQSNLVAQQSNADAAETTEWDQRIYAISPQNMRWLQRLGVWQHLNSGRVTAVQAMQIWGDTSTEAVTLNAEEVNADAMAYIIEERALRQAMLKEVTAQNLQIERGVTESLSLQSQQALIGLDNGQLIQSDLLLAADGANSWLRQQANIGVTEKDYQQTAIVANFDVEQAHADIARQWFRQEMSSHHDGTHCGILAWLPLPGRKVSIVWSAPTKLAHHLMQLDDAAFAQQVMQAGNAALGTMTLIGARAAFPLHLRKAATLVQNALVLLGDAAHRIHPMAGQGVNLGFRDVITLVEILQQRNRYQTLNDASLLRQYGRARKADVMSMTALTNGLYHVFDSENVLLRKVRNWGLLQTNRPMLRKLLTETAIAF